MLTYQFSVRFFDFFCACSQVAVIQYNLSEDFTICFTMD